MQAITFSLLSLTVSSINTCPFLAVGGVGRRRDFDSWALLSPVRPLLFFGLNRYRSLPLTRPLKQSCIILESNNIDFIIFIQLVLLLLCMLMSLCVCVWEREREGGRGAGCMHMCHSLYKCGGQRLLLGVSLFSCGSKHWLAALSSPLPCV